MPTALPGALVVSLDFELHWGVRDHQPANGSYRRSLVGARESVPSILDVFRQREVAATWAVVGFLFCRTREELEATSPPVRPRYTDPRFDPYREPLGADEAADPLHYAASLVDLIQATPRQEVGTHTFSHFFCLEQGADEAAFAADLVSARRVAELRGLTLRSLVFPRNQHRPRLERVLLAHGIRAFRGRQAGWMHQGVDSRHNTALHRTARAADSVLPLSGNLVTPWREILQPNGLADIRASAFFRSTSPLGAALAGLQHRRLSRSIRAAARSGGLFHLWWHPHNFGVHQAWNLAQLERLLDVFQEERERHGMRSLTMAEAADLARQAA